jgi:Domain of unknown function (DUF5127)
MACPLDVSIQNHDDKNQSHPNNGNRNKITGWTGMIRVDGTPYVWMGNPGNAANVNQTSYTYTSTRSIFTMDVGGLVQMNITFLSPITPDDFQRQSLPFSYVDVAVSSLDGKSHSVQLYTDISAGKSIATGLLFQLCRLCRIKMTNFATQSGLRARTVLSLNGATVPQEIWRITKSGGKSRKCLPRATSRPETEWLIGVMCTGQRIRSTA